MKNMVETTAGANLVMKAVFAICAFILAIVLLPAGTAHAATKPVIAEGNSWYRGNISAGIVAIEFVDSYTPTGDEVGGPWDASQNYDGSVVTYVVGEENAYTLLIAGNGYGRIFTTDNPSKMFYGCSGMTEIINAGLLDMSAATDTSEMFYNCTNLKSVDVSTWDMSNVTDMSNMFNGCKSLDNLDVSQWDTSSVTDMSGLFTACESVTELDVSQWDTSNVKTFFTMFFNCPSLTSIDVSNFETSSATNFDSMFMNSTGLTSIDVSNFDTSNATTLQEMFGNTGITTMDISMLDTSKVTDFSRIFHNCDSLKTVVFGNIDTSNVTTMSYLFYNCTSLESVDLVGLDTSNVEDFTKMFGGCSSLESLDLSHFDTAKGTKFEKVFYNCHDLEVLNIESWNTKSATNMTDMFFACRNLQQVTLGENFSFTGNGSTSSVLPTPNPYYIPGATGNWQAVGSGSVTAPKGAVYAPADVPSLVAETYVMEKVEVPVLAASNTWYRGATKKNAITTINIADSYTPNGDELEQWDASEAQNGSVTAYVSADGTTLTIAGNGSSKVFANPNSTRAFGDANWNYKDGNEFANLKTFNGGDVLDMSMVTNATWMFYNARLLESIDVSTWDVSNVAIMESMFGYCYAVEELAVGGWDVSSVTDFTGTFEGCKALTSLPVESWNIDSALTLEGIFCGCNSLVSLDLSAWDTAGVEDMNNMFSACYDLTTIGDITGWDTSSCTDMHQMFQNCESLEAVDLSKFDTADVVDMHNMFYSCLELTAIDVTSFDTANVKDMGSMFSMCWNLEELDVSGFNTSNTTDMSNMFANCSDLTVIDVSGFDTSKVTDLSSMFSRCTDVKVLDVSGFDTSNATDMSMMFYYCNALAELDLSSFDTSNASDMAYMLTDMEKLKKVTLGEEFSFAGSGDTRLTSLPTPNPTYIPGATGNWQAVGEGTDDNPAGAVYAPDAVPNNVAETYVMEKPQPPVLAASDTWYKGTADKASFIGINIVDSYEPTGDELESWDASAAQDGSVMAYVSADGTTLTIAGNGAGSIMANKNSSSAFKDFSSVIAINGTSLLDTSNTTRMDGMFWGCNALTSLNLDNWDVSNVYMFSLFAQDCYALTSFGPNALRNWDTSSASHFSFFCDNCESLTALDVSQWDMSKVEIANYMFSDCAALTELDISQWKLSSIRQMAYAFQDCTGLKTLDLEDWTTSTATTMSGLFEGTAFTTLDVSGLDFDSCEKIDFMFNKCAQLKSIEGISDWNLPLVRTISSTFRDCTALEELDLSGWSTPSLIDADYPFIRCSNLKVLDISGIDTSQASVSKMFDGCIRLQQVTLGEKFSFTGDGSTSCVLPTPDAKYITGATGNWQAVGSGTVDAPEGTVYLPSDVPNNVAETYVMEAERIPILAPSSSWYYGHIENADIAIINIVDSYTPDGTELKSWDASAEQNKSVMAYLSADGTMITIAGNGYGFIYANADSNEAFAYFDNLLAINGAEVLNTVNVTNLNYGFCNNPKLVSVNLDSWDVSNVTQMCSLFQRCESLESLGENGLRDWDTGKVELMGAIFEDCKSLAFVDVSGWDVSATDDLGYMFSGCTKLAEIDVSNWDVSNITGLMRVFRGCAALEELDLSGWKTGEIYNMKEMFSGCAKLEMLDLSGFNSSNAKWLEGAFDGMVRLQQVTLGDKFSFTGNGNTSCVLPTPDPTYITGAIGKWQAVGAGTVAAPLGAIYLPEEVPSNVLETYVMPPTTISVDVPIKVTLAAASDGTWCTPTAAANQIVNHSLAPVNVVSAKAAASDGFTMLAASNVESSTASNVFGGTIAAGAGTAQDLTAIDTSADAWTMAAETDSDDSDLISLQLAGSIGNVKGKYFTSGLKLFDITYTFELAL